MKAKDTHEKHTRWAARIAVARLVADLDDANVKVGKVHVDTLCWLLDVRDDDILAAQLCADALPATAEPPEVFRD